MNRSCELLDERSMQNESFNELNAQLRDENAQFEASCAFLSIMKTMIELKSICII